VFSRASHVRQRTKKGFLLSPLPFVAYRVRRRTKLRAKTPKGKGRNVVRSVIIG
jgi:hypothetical protein